jgi:uncharacterized protein YcfJ
METYLLEVFNLSKDEMKKIFKDTFRNFEGVGEEKLDSFIKNELTSIYKDSGEASHVANELNVFFDRIDTNFNEIQEGKKQSIATTRWLQNKLDGYEEVSKEIPVEIVKALNISNAENLSILMQERVGGDLLTKEYSGHSKKILTTKVLDIVTEDVSLDILKTENVFNNLNGIMDEEVVSIKKYFDIELDSPFDKSVKKVGTVAAIKIQKTGKFKLFNDKSPIELAAIIDKTFTVSKIGYKIAAGEIRASDATDYLVDRGAARLEAVVHNTCIKFGAKAGARIGAVVGSVFGPAGTAVGTAVGTVVGEIAGKYVADKVGAGIRKVASKAKKFVGAVANKVEEKISSFTSGIKSLIGW